ncbi:unnamed protein product, partial [Rotaria sp. Silwood1]
TRILCPHCKSTNPIHLRTCYICENVLMPTSTPPEKRTSISIPTISKQTNTMMITCSKCFRLNNLNARFCDWCGAYPEHTSTSIQRTKCHTNNDSFAKFCSTCGCVIEPPLRIIDTRLKNDMNISSSSMIASTLIRNSVNPVWLNANTTLTNYHQSYSTIKKEAATQTYRIYYPSAKDIDLSITQNKKLLAEKELKEYRPILTSTSPGKGYWRQQLDHICAHLKTYAVNRPDFQSLIGEPRMGNMIHATLHENEYQVTIQTVFRKPENLSQSPFFINETNEYYPINSERSSPYSNTIYSDKGYTILQLAIRNGYYECLETLIIDGKAELDKKGPRGNTALHECCLLELDGAEPLRILLKHGGDASWLNDNNESVIDIAAKQNCPELLQAFSKYQSEKMLKQHMKNSYDDHTRIKTIHDHHSSEKL